MRWPYQHNHGGHVDELADDSCPELRLCTSDDVAKELCGVPVCYLAMSWHSSTHLTVSLLLWNGCRHCIAILMQQACLLSCWRRLMLLFLFLLLLLLLLLKKKLARVVKIRGLRLEVSDFILHEAEPAMSCGNEPAGCVYSQQDPRRGICVSGYCRVIDLLPTSGYLTCCTAA